MKQTTITSNEIACISGKSRTKDEVVFHIRSYASDELGFDDNSCLPQELNRCGGSFLVKSRAEVRFAPGPYNTLDNMFGDDKIEVSLKSHADESSGYALRKRETGDDNVYVENDSTHNFDAKG